MDEILTGHTSAEHGDGGPVRHAWRSEWSRPNRELERAGQPARTRVPVEVDNPDTAGDGLTGEDRVAVALCGVKLEHRTAAPFETGHDRACGACAALLTPEELARVTELEDQATALRGAAA